jgi:hypothetical protein
VRSLQRATLRPIWIYARRCLLYNLAVTVLGTAALFAFVLATLPEGQSISETARRAARVASILGPVLLMTAGHALAVLAMRLFHGRELPYYFNANIGEAGLALIAWLLAVPVGVILLLAGRVWL